LGAIETAARVTDVEVDVAVVGLGLAGCAAAIEAAESGASVLVLEKMPEPLAGGNSRASGQRVLAADEVAALARYQHALNEPNPVPDAVVAAWAKGVGEVEDWLARIAEEAGMTCVRCPNPPEFPGFPGAESVSRSVTILPAPAGVWRAARTAVESRGVEIRYGACAVRLVREETGEVSGVVVATPQGDRTIPARRGVVLASGGFENAPGLLRDFGGFGRVYTLGSPANTGDGIRMLQRVGADLWHMRNRTHSGGLWPAIKVPGFDVAFQRGTVRAGSWLELAADGQRFHDESVAFHLTHAKRELHGVWLDLLHASLQPVHMIFDETVRLGGPLPPAGPRPEAGPGELMGWNSVTGAYRWSDDNSAEVEAGWIESAGTLEELAELIGREAAVVAAAVARFNAFAERGGDADFGRDPAAMAPILTPPFYAVEIVPGITSTTGGGRRDEQSRVLDVDGEPIEGLYEAGALGSTFANLFQNGAFLAECIVSGRAAGSAAARRAVWAERT